MKVITNERLIKRNARIGQIATFGGLLVLIGGLVITYRNPAYASLSWVALIGGFALSQIGMYFGNRWGRHPRPDELVDQGLKGLNDQ
jgi:formate hydrogenlyase subunit 3/multisubunit Na+/H+ antiporter MnhD subunit